MTILYLKHNEIDFKKWDNTITHSKQQLVYGFSWYLNIVAPNWDALITPDYSFIMPLTHRTKWGVKYLFPPAFCQQLGLFSTNNFEKNIIKEFIDSIPDKFRYIDYNLNYTNKIERFNPYNNFEIPLNNNYNKLKENYSSHCLRKIKQAEKHSFSIIQDNNYEALISLFKENKGKTIQNLNHREYEILKNIINVSIEKATGNIYYVKQNAQIIAGCFLIHCFNRHIMLFSANNQLARDTGAMYCLFDYIIQKNAEKNEIFDFEGSNIPGLARFYSGFGAINNTYFHVKTNRLPWWLKIFKH
jgi:hypothetical protein